MIRLLGGGFLGSIFAEEVYKRMYAMEDFHCEMVIADFDTFEDRNSANQNVVLDKAKEGVNKAIYLKDLGQRYGLRKITAITEKIVPENVEKFFDGAGIIVSAADNYTVRKLLWEIALTKDVPVMHLGISQAGTGSVEWSWGARYDSWPISPVALGGKKFEEPVLATLPPCDLVALRGLGLNTGLAGAKALGIFRGLDPESYFGGSVDARTITTWSSTNHSHKMVSATSFDERGGTELEVPAKALV